MTHSPITPRAYLRVLTEEQTILVSPRGIMIFNKPGRFTPADGEWDDRPLVLCSCWSAIFTAILRGGFTIKREA